VPPLLPLFEITNFTQIGTFPTGGGAHIFEMKAFRRPN
jgi:hypothetical protein